MNKKVLPLAVSAAAAVSMGSAQAAMYMNSGGTGEALIYPFYSAENGNNTLISVVNTVDENSAGAYKAVKVRILEGENSREVLDFNLYLSPDDHFSFAITAGEDGFGYLSTNDNSCTVPDVQSVQPVKFREFEYRGDKQVSDPAAASDYDNTGPERTLSGYVEIIEMGQLDPASAAIIDKATTGAINAAAAMTHDAAGKPANCDILVNAWSKKDDVLGQWRTDVAASAKAVAKSEFLAAWSGGGLYGYGVQINVENGTAYGYDAVAIADLVAAGEDGFTMHYTPGDKQPNLADKAITTEAIVVDGGKSATVDFSAYAGATVGSAQVARLQAVNSLMMTTEVMNDYVTDATIGAETDWIFTFPTKGFHVASAPTAEPFSEVWSGQSACEPTTITILDREEANPPPPDKESDAPDFSPPPPPTPGTPAANDDVPLCFETTVMQVAAESATNSDNLVIGINNWLDAADGWATITFAQAATLDTKLDSCYGVVNGTRAANSLATAGECVRRIQGDNAGQAVTLDGLPVVGFAVQKYVNGALASGTLSNYAASMDHKTTVASSGL